MGPLTLKLNRRHSKNRAQFQSRLQAQQKLRRSEQEQVTDFPVPQAPKSIFLSDTTSRFDSVDDIVVAGNKTFENLDNIDFAGFRNNKALGEKTLREVREQVTEFHSDRTSKAYKQDVSRVMHARYLQGHGVQVEAHLDQKELSKLRKYFQKETSTNNVADAARAINKSLKNGEEDVNKLTLDAEKFLFTERGLPAEQFDARFADKSIKTLAKIRDFSDAWSTSQGGKFLKLTQGKDFDANRDSMAREMLAANGYQHVNSIDLDTVLSLLRDIDAEGPNTNATIRKTVNTAIAEGEKDYFVLNTMANKAILNEIGLDETTFQQLDVSDESYSGKYPELAPREARAIRTRVLRDLLRVLPADERQAAIDDLKNQDSNLILAEKTIKQHLGGRIRGLVGNAAAYGDMGAMQRANFTAALKKLPEGTRRSIFSSTPGQAKKRLETLIESKFGIEVHREAGRSPDGDPGFSPFVKDWTIQGLVDLHNAMENMSSDGRLPETLIGNATVCFVQGSPKENSMSVGPQPISSDPVGPWNRPGAFAHASGKSGFFGMAGPDKTGHDIVYLFDDALMDPNSDSALGVTIGESTLVHEFGHAIQLGGTPGADKETRVREEQLLVAEWSSLSRWNEPHDILADGKMGSFGYYYDPTVQVTNRHEVATSYGASDPIEDFAEYTPFFFAEPETAMALSVEKFLYYNQMVGNHYTPEQISQVADKLGIDAEALKKADNSMMDKVLTSAEDAGLVA